MPWPHSAANCCAAVAEVDVVPAPADFAAGLTRMPAADGVADANGYDAAVDGADAHGVGEGMRDHYSRLEGEDALVVGGDCHWDRKKRHCFHRHWR